MSALASSLGNGELHLPTVLLPDGSHLLAPTVRDLADKVGLHTKATRPFYDLVVIGAGPAGLANALYGASEGLHVLLIEQNAPGGQAGTSSMIENYLGFPAGVTGADLAQRATAQARRFGVEILTAQEVVGLRREDPYRIVKLADGSEVSAYAVVIATGMSVRKLDVPGVDPLIGIGVYYGAAMTEAATYRKQDVCIVGGCEFRRTGRAVFLALCTQGHDARAGEGAGTVDVALSRRADRKDAEHRDHQSGGGDVGVGRGQARARHAETVRDREARTIDVSAMFIFIGVAPRSEMFASVLARDEKGFILTGEDLPRVSGKPRDWTLDRDPVIFRNRYSRCVRGRRRARQRESARGRSGRRGISGDLFGASVPWPPSRDLYCAPSRRARTSSAESRGGIPCAPTRSRRPPASGPCPARGATDRLRRNRSSASPCQAANNPSGRAVCRRSAGRICRAFPAGLRRARWFRTPLYGSFLYFIRGNTWITELTLSGPGSTSRRLLGKQSCGRLTF
jgi:thioredoxin reductase